MVTTETHEIVTKITSTADEAVVEVTPLADDQLRST